MLFWFLVVTATAVACAALYVASAGRAVNAAADAPIRDGAETFAARLRQIERDMAEGRLAEADGVAAKAELAREVLRHREEEAASLGRARRPLGRAALALATLAVAGGALGLYAVLGQPDLPAQPLVARTDLPGTFEDAVARIEEQMLKTPDDVRGWQALGPAYLQLGRIDDAVRAFRRIAELSPPSAEVQSDLGEVLMMAQGGDATGEPLALFRSAAELDATNARSRFYLASEATRTGDFGEAVGRWRELLALSEGGESWLPVAERGLQVALAGLDGQGPSDQNAGGGGLSIELAPQGPAADPGEGASQPATDQPAVGANAQADQDAQIRGMVEGLQARLDGEGGTLEEWTRLVRSWLVLGETEKARTAYAAAVAAHPDAAERAELDAMAKSAGLEAPSAGVSP